MHCSCRKPSAHVCSKESTNCTKVLVNMVHVEAMHLHKNDPILVYAAYPSFRPLPSLSPSHQDFGVEHLISVANRTSFPWLMSNVRDRETGQMLAEGREKMVLEWQGRKVPRSLSVFVWI